MSLEWRIHVEFVTPRLAHGVGNAEGQGNEDVYWDELLEEVESGDRGTIFAASERLPCESFEVGVPVRVYGAVTGTETRMEEGLPV